MDTVLSQVPAWVTVYWVGVTVVRLILSVFVVLMFGRTAPHKSSSARTVGIGMTSIVLAVWVLLAIFLGSRNVFRIDQDTPLPPPVALGALLPIIAGYLVFRYWQPLRRIITNIPQHWLIALQSYRMTGAVFLVLYAQGSMPGVFALPAGIGDLVTGALALPVAYFCYRRKPWSRPMALLWNGVGLAELLMLIPLGILSSPTQIQMLALDAPNFLTSAWPVVLAPTFHVPLGILLHIFSFALLERKDGTEAKSAAPSLAWQIMLFSAIAIAVYVVLFYVASPLLTPRPIAFQVYPGLQQVLAAHPAGLYLHIVPAALALVLGPLQFLEKLRRKHLGIHRWIGRTYLVSGVLFGGVGALYLAQFSFAGLGAQLGFSLQALLLLFTGYMAYANIRQRRVQGHREWMMRNYALLFGAVTLRLYIRLFFSMGLELPDFHAVNAWLCWVPNLIVVEWLIHRARMHRTRAMEAFQATGPRPF